MGCEDTLDDQIWGKRVYVWFDAVQGYLTCARIWSERVARRYGDEDEAWRKCGLENGNQRHVYFMGKDNIPFHTIIWPGILMALNNGRGDNDRLHLEDNVAQMLPHALGRPILNQQETCAVWLPTFLERYDPDTIRYHLTVNMPELHDTDFTWREYVDKVNNELIGTYANYVNRVLTLVSKASTNGKTPILDYPGFGGHPEFMQFIQGKVASLIESMERQRFKEALRRVMDIAQEGNGFLQRAEPWKYLRAVEPREREKALRPLSAAMA